MAAESSYTKTRWVIGKPISQELMNNIESGIEEAYNCLGRRYTKTEIDNKIVEINDSITGVRSTAENAESIANTANEATIAGTNAWAQLLPLIELDAETGDIITSLATRITGDETSIGVNTGDIAQVKRWVTDATKVGTVRKIRNDGEYYYDRADALSEKIADIDRLIEDTQQDIGSIVQTISPNNGRSFGDRLYALDGNTTPSMNVPTIITELTAARGTNSNGGANLSLSDRFTQDEARLSAIDGNTTPIRTLPNVITEIANAHRTNDDTLDARFDSIDGGSAPSRTLPNVITEINDAHRANVQGDTLTQRFNALDTSIGTLENNMGSGFDNTNTVAAKITAAEASAKSYTDTKVSELHIGEINDAHRTNLVDPNTNEPIIDTLDKRFDDAEDRIGQNETDIQTIANELNMYTQATGTIAGTNSRIDQLETNMVSMANEIGMLQNGETVQDMASAISGANTRIDSIQSEVQTARGTGNDSLNARLNGIDTTVSGIGSQVSTHDNDINNATTGLKAKVASLEESMSGIPSANDVQQLQTDVGNLQTTVGEHTTSITNLNTAINNNSTTIILSKTEVNFEADNKTPTTLKSGTINNKDDYLIQSAEDDKYYYWKYIQTNDNPVEYTWTLISGAGGGGSGSSSGEFAASLESIVAPNENTDYFVGNNNIGYTHYRYIPSEEPNGIGTFVRILPKNLLHNVGVNANGGLEGYTVEDSSTNVFADFMAFKDVTTTPVTENEQVVATDLIFTDTNGQTHTARVTGGGGGGAVSSYTMRLNNALSSLKLTVPKKDGFTATVSAIVVVKDGGVIDETFDQSHIIDVAVQYRLSNTDPWTNYTTISVLNNTEFTVDIESILTLGTKTYVRLNATTTIDEEVKSSALTYEVTQVEMSIDAVNFNPATVRTTNFNFQYRCMGSGLTKIVHFLIDGNDITGSPITTTLHNDIGQQTIPLTGLQVGMHSFQVYFTVNGIESNILNYYIIYNNDQTRVAPIVALAAEKDTITYGDELKINYTVATVGSETTDKVLLELYTLDGSTEIPIISQSFVNVQNEQVREWRPTEYPESGKAYIRATATHTIDDTDYTDVRTIEITIHELVLPAGYSLSPAGSESLVYSYNAYGRTNNDAGKEQYIYPYKALTGQDINWQGDFNGFNWSGDGYIDGQSLLISGGATHTVNVPIFQNTYNEITLESSEGIQNITQHGRTIEIEYEVQSATDLNDVIIDFMSNVTTRTENGVTYTGGTGFQITPQSCYLLKGGSTVNTDSTGFILNESDIAAAYLTPGTRTHIAFVIEPWSDKLAYDQSYHQSVNIYVNGEFANACPYVQGTDNFASNATLRIGSSSCIIKLYQIKMYNRGLTHKEILQNYKVAPATTREKLNRLYDNDILNADGYVDYEKARTKYTCLLLTGPAPIYTETTGGETVLSNPTVSPYKGYPSPAHRKDKKTGEAVGKTESGLTLTKPNANVTQGYDVEFDLRDTIPTDQSIDVPAYMGDRGAYVSSNNVQGTSSQKYPVHNLKVYLAKWQGPKTTTSWVDLEENEEVAEGTETRTVIKKQVEKDGGEYEWVIVEDGEDTTGLTTQEVTQKKVVTTTSAEIKKVKYSLKGKDEHGDDIGFAESTLCWKADYMSTDHANTFNANIADGLFTETLPGASWGTKHQNTVYGIRCLLFQKQGNAAPEFLGDGCLNNDKGNNKTFDLERDGDKDADTSSQKWELTNNSDDLGYFKTDTVFRTVGTGSNAHIQALDAFESTYPDQGDLEDANKVPNYNHLQILLTWLSKRANYWDETDPSVRAAKKQIFIDEFEDHINMDHALTYYLFSEYVALCDNRVKNMFLRSDNVKSENVYKISDGQAIFEGNSNPNADFFKQIDAIDTGTTQQVAVEDPETHEITYTTEPVYRYELHNRDDIDWENSTFAIWAPVLYDLDSCFGVENVGYIRVRYDANWDYTWNNAPQFNGYESRLWLQFADCFDAEIKTAALTLYNRADGLNYTNFYRQQIQGNLANISPALSNQDMLVKFDKPWSEGFINYSLAEPAKETPQYKYLQRGSRTAQKTQFMNMRSKLLSSKYGANEFTNDAIKFRTGVPVGQSNLADTKITIVANQAMYPGVAYGDNKDPTRATANGGKINAGQPCDIQATSPVQGNDGIFICGASMLTDIGDLSAFRPYQIDVGAGVNLKRLIVGSDAVGYTNGNTDTFSNLNKCVLLEEINIRNCSNVSTLNLSNNPLIKEVYAAGSGATTIIFPNGGVLNTVEYSTVTGDITLQNQKSLTNFSYEDSENNNYASLTKLWIENTPNVPVVDIINHALGHLNNGVRLVGLDIELNNDPTFLQTITSELAKGKYLDSTGAYTPGNTNYPYISGKVHISRIRASLLAEVNRLYPDLIVYNTMDAQGNISNNIDSEYTIEYWNYNQTVLLYTDHRVNGESYIDPVYDTNPITNTYYIPMPEKPADAQYKYKFGTYNARTGNYNRYSGWVRRGTTINPTSSDPINGNVTFVAYYPTTEDQYYTVRWFDKYNGTVFKDKSVKYGTDLSYESSPIDTGALSRIDISGNTTKVFTGWSRPLGKITANVDVYGQWQVSNINDNTPSIVMENLTAADIYALSQVDASVKNDLFDGKLGTPIFIPMGQEFNYTEGATVTNLLPNNEEILLDGTTDAVEIYDNITPLSINSDWTLALDYKFLMDSANSFLNGNEFVIASCYQNISGAINGFKVSLIRNTSDTTHSIVVTWGTQSVTIDYGTTGTGNAYFTSYRNMVVLSHNMDTPTQLRVSYVLPNTTNQNAPVGANCGTYVTNTNLVWSSNTPITTPLIIGGNYNGATTNIETNTSTRKPAQGIIYWAKFWDADLGEQNCTKLASWVHETVPFYLSGYNDSSAVGGQQIYEGSELSFVAAQGLGDRYFYAKRGSGTLDSDGLFGWHQSEARSICNNLVYAGMPEAYKSIIRQTTVNFTKRDVQFNSDQTGANIPDSTLDYLFLPSVREVEAGDYSSGSLGIYGNEVRSSWQSPWHWMIASSRNVLGYISGSTTTLETKTNTALNIFRYRFLGSYIKDDTRIFNINADPTGSTLYYRNSSGSVEVVEIQSGDIWINNDNTAYIYCTPEEIDAGVSITSTAAGGTGGWKRADMWNLRTFNAQSNTTSENSFLRVRYNGTVDTTAMATQNTADGRLICPEFTV